MAMPRKLSPQSNPKRLKIIADNSFKTLDCRKILVKKSSKSGFIDAKVQQSPSSHWRQLKNPCLWFIIRLRNFIFLTFALATVNG